NFEPVAVPLNQYGNFYSGDSYIVLKTSGASNLSWDIHFWLGSNTSQDEAGAAAILSVNLDDEQFHGDAVQHRETQGHESRQFLSYFEPVDGIKMKIESTKRLFVELKKITKLMYLNASIENFTDQKNGCQVAKPTSRTDQPVWPDIWVERSDTLYFTVSLH
ncbi:Gelsolin, partial [Papilio machaon]